MATDTTAAADIVAGEITRIIPVIPAAREATAGNLPKMTAGNLPAAPAVPAGAVEAVGLKGPALIKILRGNRGTAEWMSFG